MSILHRGVQCGGMDYGQYIQRGKGGFGGHFIQRGKGAFGIQREIKGGQGIGSFLSSLASKILPLAKRLIQSSVGRSVIKTTKKAAVDTGLKLAEDVIAGRKVKDSLKESLSISKDKIISSAIDSISAKRPVKRKKKQKQTYHTKTHVKSKKQKRNSDIFDDYK